MKKFGNFEGNILSKNEMKKLNGGKSFPCSCNGVSNGDASTVKECVDRCL